MQRGSGGTLWAPGRRLVCLLLPGILGCVGVSTMDPGASNRRPGDGSSTAVPSADWGNATAEELCPPGTVSPIPAARLWRLSSVQYANTLKAIFGAMVDPATLPLDGVHDDGVTRFDTNADSNLVNDRLAAVYQDQAGTTAQALVASLGSTPHACATTATATSACVRAFVSDFASRAFRRPLTAAETDRLVGFYNAQKTTYDAAAAARMVLEAILQSPHFLYRFELGNESSGSKVALTQHELASQLSYFLTDAPPDATLLAAAERGELTDRAKVREQATRLLGIATARGRLKEFFKSYLHLTDLISGAKAKNAQLFPAFTETVKQALVTETLTFVDKAVFDQRESLDGLWSANYSYQNATVAEYYGTTATSADYTRVTLPEERTGLLSQAGVIAALSGQSSTSPIHRGVFFLNTLMCRKLPTPPPNASSMTNRLSDPNNPTGTQREQWTYFQKNAPECASCHVTFQPMDLGLENFDAVGVYRTTENGKTIDPSINLTGLDPAFDGAHEDALALAKKIAASPLGQECFIRQYSTFSLGRTIGTEEACRVHAIAERFEGKPLGVQELLLEMTQEDGFYFRSYL